MKIKISVRIFSIKSQCTLKRHVSLVKIYVNLINRKVHDFIWVKNNNSAFRYVPTEYSTLKNSALLGLP